MNINKNVQGHLFALTANVMWGLMAATIMVIIGKVVVTIEASMGEVRDNPKIKTPWLKTSAKRTRKIF